MPLRKDIWRPAIARAPIGYILEHGLKDVELCWLPAMGSFRFLADPFGLWRGDRLYIFVETYDYRVRIGAIEVLIYSKDLELLDRRPALAEPWHLSYPFVFEAEGSTWMLPEAHRSGRLTLYRATKFPTQWEVAHVISLDHVAVDATPFFHQGLWWIFYTSADREADKMSALHVSFAERLEGPWTAHRGNPVVRDMSGARPGGTPFSKGGEIILPTQDCSRTYGGAIRPLRIGMLTPDRFESELGPEIGIPPSAAPFREGLHTLSAAENVTLVDMKRTELSLHGLSIEVARETKKLLRSFASRSSSRSA